MNFLNLLDPPVPSADDSWHWSGLARGADALAVARLARKWRGPLLLVTEDSSQAQRLEAELRFYLGPDNNIPVLVLPDWETLPYDLFSPHQDLVSTRLSTLYRLPHCESAIIVVSITTLMQRLPPADYVSGNCLLLHTGQVLDPIKLRLQLDKAGYRLAESVYEHGEFAQRGAIFDLFPMGSLSAIRIEFFDNEIASLRSFDTETQRSGDQVERIDLLPARELPIDKPGIARFREQWHLRFDVDHRFCPLYQDVSQGLAPGGIEYYLPLFFTSLSCLFDYLPAGALIVTADDVHAEGEKFWKMLDERYQDRNIDLSRPLLRPGELFLPVAECFARMRQHPRIRLDTKREVLPRDTHHGDCKQGPDLSIDSRAAIPLQRLINFLRTGPARVLLCAESAGRREVLLELLRGAELEAHYYPDWRGFEAGAVALGVTVFALESGFVSNSLSYAVISESQLFGQRVQQVRRRRRAAESPDTMVRNLAELRVGAPVVHVDHGVGRYLGLVTLEVDGEQTEFLSLEYAAESRLYVPVSSLHLINRYSGADPDEAPLHRLGGDHWQRIRRKAAEKIRDTAAELLEVYARREARIGHAFSPPDEDYQRFCDAFPFEETPDQAQAISTVIADMCAERTMDRLICGDVGFGKTEVAMRASFLAINDGKQVAILVPTTLLAQQHFETFSDRFADLPISIELLSRFRSRKEQQQVIERLHAGRVDILIGTHKLLQGGVRYHDLGLLVIDEEHRFGVRQKEWLKSLRAEVDILTLTATPIPRTLNLAMSGLRELSIIATPPAGRLAVKTFVQAHNNTILRDAINRELRRGGQVFYVHNVVRTIERRTKDITDLVPEARVAIGHGQMRALELERVMSDFYHKRSNVLCCTTIIETGIDIPSANTIIIDRADKFGLAQLHQLRGRVGRSHHQAYAYLLIPEHGMTADAEKRLQAIVEADTLGAGFLLATHDLEIRGAGELLGDEQSGQIESIGFSLYMDMLERTVKAIRSGESTDIDTSFSAGLEVNLRIPALIPEDYLPDAHHRLVLYKRIAGATDSTALRELQVEMIDRFGLLPQQTHNLFSVTGIKMAAEQLGIERLDASATGGALEFSSNPVVDPLAIVKLVQSEPDHYRLDGGTRLRFDAELESHDERIEFLESLLSRLGAPPAQY